MMTEMYMMEKWERISIRKQLFQLITIITRVVIDSLCNRFMRRSGVLIDINFLCFRSVPPFDIHVAMDFQLSVSISIHSIFY